MMELTVLMPCLNEAETIGLCIERAKRLLETHGINGEILISDNGSTDGSQELAVKLGARVILCPVKGYGAALQYGIERAEGAFVVMGDSDDSYHFDEAFAMVEKLRAGYDVCMGTRLKGRIMPGAMPFLNRYLGNPVLTAIGRLFFRIEASDFHCGMRAFRREAVLGLGLVTTGMEWASEMIIKARLSGLSMAEVPITLFKDGRSRPPHLRPWRDGWRHLRFMLLHAPTWLFVYPGMALTVISLAFGSLLLRGMLQIGPVNFDVHSLLTMAFLAIIGLQTLFAGVFANLYGQRVGILPTVPPLIERIKGFSLEKLLVSSLLVGLVGIAWFSLIFWSWYSEGFPQLDYQLTMRRVVPALTLLTVGVLGIFNSFLFSMLFLETRESQGASWKRTSR